MAFAGLEAFNKGMCSLISNQPMNSLFDMPKIIGKSFLEQSKKRVAQNKGLRKKFYDKYDNDLDESGPLSTMKRFQENFGYGQAAKSMFYNRAGELSTGRVATAASAGIAGTAIAGSYVLGGDD